MSVSFTLKVYSIQFMRDFYKQVIQCQLTEQHNNKSMVIYISTMWHIFNMPYVNIASFNINFNTVCLHSDGYPVPQKTKDITCHEAKLQLISRHPYLHSVSSAANA